MYNSFMQNRKEGNLILHLIFYFILKYYYCQLGQAVILEKNCTQLITEWKKHIVCQIPNLKRKILVLPDC